MKLSSSIFILSIIVIFVSKSSSNTGKFFLSTKEINYFVSYKDTCSGRWQIIDKLNIKSTFNWQILPKSNVFITEFRTNLVAKGFWYGFSFSFSPDKPVCIIKKKCTSSKKKYIAIFRQPTLFMHFVGEKMIQKYFGIFII